MIAILLISIQLFLKNTTMTLLTTSSTRVCGLAATI